MYDMLKTTGPVIHDEGHALSINVDEQHYQHQEAFSVCMFLFLFMKNDDMTMFVDRLNYKIYTSCTKGQALCGSHAFVNISLSQSNNL